MSETRDEFFRQAVPCVSAPSPRPSGLSFDRRLPAPMHSLDARFRIVDVSDDWLALLGYERAEVIGRPVSDFLTEQSAHRIKENWPRFLADGEIRGIERQFVRKDGRLVDTIVSARAEHGEAGALIGTRSVLTDITERKRADLALRRSEHIRLAQAERQAAVLDALPAHVALLDRTGRITAANKAWREFGRQAGYEGAGVGVDYRAVCEAAASGGDAQAGRVAAALRELMVGTRTQYSLEYRCSTPRGDRWFQMTVVPQSRAPNADLVVVHTDVTQIKQAEEELKRERRFSELVLASIGEGIFAYDRNARITVWNDAMVHQFRIAREQALGRGVFDVFPSHRGTAIETAVCDAISGRDTSFPETSLTGREIGHIDCFEAHYSPLYGEAGDIVGGVAFLRDATQRRRTEEQLRQAQKMEAVGQITSGIAHDFNNILWVITLSLEQLEAKLAGQPPLQQMARVAALATDRAERLIGQLLTFARKQPLQPEASDLNGLIADIGMLLDHIVGQQISIQRDMAEGLWPVMIDRQQFEAAVMNLLANARDAMHGSGGITLGTSNVKLGGDGRYDDVPAGDYVAVSVADTGQGIPPEVLPRIFDPFFTTKDAGKGTGLGLSMVHGFVSHSGGRIDVDSTVGRGTTITLYFPRAAGEPRAPGTERRPGQIDQPTVGA
jgi:PAS domain S-box-containing protein